MEAQNSEQSASLVMKYRRGNRVEVASKEEGFVGSYFGATIVTKLNGDEYIVTYHNLLKDDLSGPLREVVSVNEIRPEPPEIEVTSFNLGDEIDAFDNDGWWVGKISGRIGSHHYSVYFGYTGEEIVYPGDRLRVHQDFVKGKWISLQKRGNFLSKSK
ncbi:hypothetical protein M9H77_21180 [Catharanthus roseus]|uniref:Uncharacterized protein n=1 Tax=Catharanthus roseus TaxID=4058 RepID=A0ACC0ALK1_CATRO|nr:hypothetical protein M9H77_21180 [Catharanthus roseus]